MNVNENEMIDAEQQENWMNKRPSKSEEIGQTEMCCTTTGNNVNKG